jgi:predicted RNase H-like HicB family nuclease
MQYSINLKIERFNEKDESYFVATSLEVPGLVAEANTIEVVLEIAADLAPMLIELEDSI